MTDRELMQRALDAMLNNPDDISDEMFEAIRALKARLAQPDQEPRQWQGLTEAEKVNVAIDCGCADVAWMDFADAIEAKLKEKNT